MKKLLTLCFLLLTLIAWSQDRMFVHTATASNISNDLTYIDHPLLNDNPSAQFVVSHVWNPPGSSGIYNNHRTGIYYSGTVGQWGVYNEDSQAIVEGSSYFIYVEVSNEMFEHITDAGNQGSDPSYTVLDHPDLNGNPEAQVIASTYFNPNSSRNDFTYGTWYDGANWNLYTQDGSPIQLGDAFIVAKNSLNTVGYRHVATAGTISNNYTIISHPNLDGNPDARFVFLHNWGEGGQPSNVIVNHILGAWYTGSNWSIYTEDLADFPANSEFDLLIFDPSLGTDSFEFNEVSVAPNPVTNNTTFNSKDVISEITITNLLGQTVRVIDSNDIQLSIDLSNLASGQYLARVVTTNGSQVIKLIKE